MAALKTLRCFVSTVATLTVLTAFSLVQAQTSTWRTLADPRSNEAVWMASSSVGWAVGASGSISQTTDGGATWTPQPSGVTVDLNGIWGTSDTSVWTVGDGGTVLFWNGTSWTTQTTGVTSNLSAISGFNASNVWAVGAASAIIKWNGTAWTTQDAPNNATENLNGVWAASANTVIAVGDNGQTLRTLNSGTAWNNFDSFSSATTIDLQAVWGSAGNSIWIVGTGGTVRFWNGTDWGAQTSGLPANRTLFSISGANATNVWAAGTNGEIIRFNGTTWSNPNSDTAQVLNGIHVVDTSNIVAVGARKSSTRWNGTTWSATQSQFPATTFTDVWASDDDKAWFTNTNGLIIRWNGTTFANTTSGVTTSLTAIWGFDDANIWAVGAAGVILKWNGTTWSPQTSGVAVTLNDVWGTSATNVWAVGDNGTILRWNGTAWTPMTSGTTRDLNAIWARDSANAWVVGDRGTILKGSTTSWAAQTSGITSNLNAIWGSSSNVWSAGVGGTILKLTGSTWAPFVSDTNSNITDLTGTTLGTTQLWAGAGAAIRSSNGTASWAADGTTNVSLTVAGLWALAPTSVFLTTTGGMIFTNAPSSIPQINVLRPAVPQPLPLSDARSTLDLGPTNTGTTTTVTLTIRNTGTAALTGLAITNKAGPHLSEFTVTEPLLPSLNANQTTTFDVTFTPTTDGLRTASFRIASNDPTEPSFLISLAGTGQTPPTFTTAPSSRAINPGASTTFSVVVAGTKPITYQWRKNGIDIPGATAASYTRSRVTELDQDTYDVVATNIAGSLDSPDATLTVNDPVVITVPPVTQSANAGTTVTFSVVGTGTPPFTYQWTRNRVAIAGATSDTFVIPSAQVTNAAAYAVVVRNVVGPVTSPSANLAVADSTLRILALPTGATATIAAPISGTFTSFVWTQGSSPLPTGPLPADPRYTGFAGKTLKITRLIESDASFLRLDVEAPGTPPATLTTQTQLIVYNAPPAITLPGAPPNDVLLLPDAQVAATYTYSLPYDPDPLKTPTAFSVSGLPTGLKIDSKTGIVSGKPAVALTAARTYPLTFTASNAKGRSTAKGSITLQPLPPGTTGTFTGPIAQESTINLDLGGRIDATLTSTGSFSGKIILGALTYSFKDVLVSTSGNPQPTAVATILRRGLSNLTVSFTVDGPNHRLINGQISDGTQTTTFDAWKNRWNTTTPAPELTTLRTEYPGYYTFALPAATPLSATVPQGAGSGSFAVSASTGRLTVAGRLADGTAFTTATFAGPLGEILVYQNLHSKLGSIIGTLDITPGTSGFDPTFGDSTLGGNLTWKKPASTSRTYGDAFTTTMATIGSRYIAPARTEVVMGLIDNGSTNNASLKFTEGGISDTFTSPDVDVRIRIGGSVIRPVLSPAAPSLTISPSTGLFSGSFTRIDQNPAVPGTTITRTSSYRGFLVRTPTGWVGSGYFLLAKRPAASTTEKVTTTDILSGLVELKPLP